MRFRAALGVFVLLASLGISEAQQKAIEVDLPAARIAKARADVQQIAKAVELYRASTGRLPESLMDLVRPEDKGGAKGAPFLRSLPTPPAGWGSYMYAREHGRQPDRFTVSSSGNGVTVSAPE